MKSAMTKYFDIFHLIMRPNFLQHPEYILPSCGNQKFDILPVCNLLGGKSRPFV